MADDEKTAHIGSDATVAAEHGVGKVIGNFRLDRRLGEGAFGVVYKAYDLITERDVALKVVRIDDAASRESFLNEARKAAKLQHTNIVRVLHVMSDPGAPLCIVMEYVDGDTLATVITQEAPFPPQAALAVIRDIASGLSHAHVQGIVHLDIKPGNILLDQDTCQAKVTDFGMAMHHAERWSRGHGGTLLYMAPEQVKAKTEQFDGRTDIWALGIVLYELLTGKKPFGGDKNSSINQVIEEIVRVHPKPPSQWNSRVSAALDDICLKCLEKDIADRYPSVSRLAENIDAAEKQLATDQSNEASFGFLTGNSTRASMALRGCLVVVGTIIVIGMMILGLQHPQEADRFLKQLLKAF